MAEIEFAGIKFKGGKMVAVAMGLSTLVGGLYGGFEVYKDYMDMKEMIQEYVAPDLSGFQEQISVIEQKMVSTEDSVIQATDYARQIKNDLKDDVTRIETLVDRLEDDMRESEKEVREMVDEADIRFDNKRDRLYSDTDRKIKELDDRLSVKIQEALDNPLAN
jgi:predicted  nucleic acid-binding Zn-ribbon protein